VSDESIEATEGIGSLLSHRPCVDEALLEQVRRAISDPVPAVRFQTVVRLLPLHDKNIEALWSILASLVPEEPRGEIRSGTLYAVINPLAGRYRAEVIGLIGDLLRRTNLANAVARTNAAEAAPTLRLLMTTSLPTNGGHDLSLAYGNTDLFYVTTMKQVYLFHKSTNIFTLLQDTPNIKSINRQPATGQLTSPHASCKEDSWCTNVFDLLHPTRTRERPTAAVYRARLFRADYQ
jgi:hypothetical protein